MSRLTWGDVGERFYEAGVDRGVLYIDGADGVPWNGLVSVVETPSGGGSMPYYLEGIKYLNRSESEEFEAAIEAYTYPDEFAQCDGTAPIKHGLFVTQQNRKSFGLSYRTRVGNDVDGSDHGYKLHIVYKARAEPTTRSNNTYEESVDPLNFSWALTTRPMLVKGHKPAAHFVIDSREAPAGVLAQIEDVLYGTDESPSRLPSIPELVYIFEFFNSSFFSAGNPQDPYYNTFDGGIVPEVQTSTIDGGAP